MSTASAIASICNIALQRIGVKQTVTDITVDATPEANACNAVWATVRDMALSEAQWPFATTEAVLVAAASSEIRVDWAYAYVLPAGCLKAWSIYPGVRAPRADQRIPFETQLDLATGLTRVILTDAPPTVDSNSNPTGPVLRFTKQLTDPTGFPPKFVDALAWLLAAELALAIPQKPALEQQCRQRYQMALASAIASARNEGREDLPPTNAYLTARG